MKISTAAATVVQVSSQANEVACDGGGGVLGHPLIYLPFSGKSEVVCYYCGRRFVKKQPKS